MSWCPNLDPHIVVIRIGNFKPGQLMIPQYFVVLLGSYYLTLWKEVAPPPDFWPSNPKTPRTMTCWGCLVL